MVNLSKHKPINKIDSNKSNESECQIQSANCYEEIHCQGTGLNGLINKRSLVKSPENYSPLIPVKIDVYRKKILFRNVFRELTKKIAIVMVRLTT